MKRILREIPKKNKPNSIWWNPPPPSSFMFDGKDHQFVDRKTRRKYKRMYEKIKSRHSSEGDQS